MVKSFKKVLACILSVLMVVSMLPMTAFAAAGDYHPNIELQFGTFYDTGSGSWTNMGTASAGSTFDYCGIYDAKLTPTIKKNKDGSITLQKLELKKEHADIMADVLGVPSIDADYTYGVGDYFTISVVAENVSIVDVIQTTIGYSDNIEPAGLYKYKSGRNYAYAFGTESERAAAKEGTWQNAGTIQIVPQSCTGINEKAWGVLADNDSYVNTNNKYIFASAITDNGQTVDTSVCTSPDPSIPFVDPVTGSADGYDYKDSLIIATFGFKKVAEGDITFSVYDPENLKHENGNYSGGYLIAQKSDGIKNEFYTSYAVCTDAETHTIVGPGATKFTIFGMNVNSGEGIPGDEPEKPHVHHYTPVVTAPTCTERGYTTYTCDNADGKCDRVSYVDDYVDARHTPVSANNAVPATPAKDGHEADTICDVCKQTLKKGAVIPALGVNVTIDGAHKSYGTVNMAWGVNNVKYGSTVTITAAPLEDCDFVGYEVAGKLVSKDPTYTYVAYKDITITPVFVPHAEDTITVLFYDKYSNVVANYTDVTVEDFQAAMAASIPTAPTYAGYTFTGWSLTDEQIKALDQSTTIWAYYAEVKDESFTVKTTVDSTLTVNRGTEVTPTEYNVTFDTKATVYNENATAWSVDGTIVGYGDTYEFYVGSDITVEPVFTTVEAKATVTMIKNYLIKEGSHKVMFLASMNVPDGYTLVDHGFVYGKNLADADMTLENVGNTGTLAGAGTVKVTSAGTSPVEQFGISYGIKAKTGKACAKAFLTYVKDGELHTIYSDAVEYAY